MSIFFRSRPPETRDSMVSWGSGEDYSPTQSVGSALSVVPLYAAVKLIADGISTMPVHCYTRRTDGTRDKVALPRSIAQPAVGTTVDWVQRALISMLLRGNAFGLLSGVSSNGWPADVTWLNPEQVTWNESHGWLYKGRPVERDQMLHIPAVTVPGEVLGISPVQAFAATFEAAREAQTASKMWAKNRAVPGMKLKNTSQVVTPEKADEISERAKAKVRHGEPFVIGKDWDMDILSIPAGDAAFLESIKANATQIATIFNLPPEVIGGSTGGSLTYNTVEQQLIQILTFGMRPWMVKFEMAVSAALMPRPQYIKFNADALVRVDTKTRYETHKIAREIGLNNVDELREIEDLTPLPDGQGADYTPTSVKGAAMTRETT